MIYDKELDQWFLSEFHRDRYMRCQENGGFLNKRYILNEVEMDELRKKIASLREN